MKKLVTMMIAVMIMAFSMVSALAISVDSPVSTTVPETEPETTSPVSVPDTGATSPKTGYGSESAKSGSDILAYTLIAASVIGCGLASVALVRTAKKK